MRKVIGGLVLAAGVGGLGYWGSQDQAKDMQASIDQAAAQAVAGAVHDVQTTVAGRDIAVTGLADSDEEKAQLLAALNDVRGRRVVHDELKVLERATPFVFEAQKMASGLSYNGVVPTDAARADLTAQFGAGADLRLASGAPDGNWTQAATAGMAALGPLNSGALRMEDSQISLAGEANSPAERDAALAILADLPEGYAASHEITMLDDGKPFSLDVSFDGARAVAAGKLPKGVIAGTMAAGAGLGDIAGDVMQGAFADDSGLWPDIGQAGLQALGLLKNGALSVQGNVLRLSGEATPQGRDAALAVLEQAPEGTDVRADIAIYDDGRPFRLLINDDGTGAQVSGKLPAGYDLGAAPLGEAERAYIDDVDGTFTANAMAGQKALSLLENGTLEATAARITLTGTARTPAEVAAVSAALEARAEGTDVALTLDTLDDGTPPAWTLNYDAATGAVLSGKLPAGLDTATAAKALGLERVGGDARAGLIGAPDAAAEALGAIADWLPEFDTFALRRDGDALSVEGNLAPGVDQELVSAALMDAFGENTSVTLGQAPAPVDGATRRNAATGLDEVAQGGFWLPVVTFEPDAQSCDTQAKAVLVRSRIGFVTGSARLDGRSTRAVNGLAAVMRLCLEQTELQATLGGHTDSTGNAEANQTLSQNRADAVRDALIARGVPTQLLRAQGFGASQPIASNDTETGRAANRRTSVQWREQAPEPSVMPSDEGNAVQSGAEDAPADQTQTKTGE